MPAVCLLIAAKHALLTGVEGHDVEGESDELQFVTHGPTADRSGGHQRIASLFAEDVFAATEKFSLTAGVRYDHWHNFDAFRDASKLHDRGDSAWSPRLSAIFQATSAIAFTASVYRSFRVPTLNELYRGFRVGNVVTNANESLGPEHLSAVESGARVSHVRVSAFDMRVADTIANVTLASTPALITRQRQNLGGSRTRGVEIEGDWMPGRRWHTSAGWLLVDAVVTSGSLSGKRLPQVPRNQANLRTSYDFTHAMLTLQTRWSGQQYDDDLNQFPLRAYFAADASANIPLQHGLVLLVAARTSSIAASRRVRRPSSRWAFPARFASDSGTNIDVLLTTGAPSS